MAVRSAPFVGPGSPINEPAVVLKALKIEGRFLVGVAVRLEERDDSGTTRDLSEDLAPAMATSGEPKFLHISLLDEEEDYEDSWIKKPINPTSTHLLATTNWSSIPTS